MLKSNLKHFGSSDVFLFWREKCNEALRDILCTWLTLLALSPIWIFFILECDWIIYGMFTE